MLTIRKLAFLVVGMFLFILYYNQESSAPPSLVRKPHRKTEPGRSSSTGKTEDEIEQILALANRPLKAAEEFKNLREHLQYLFPYQGAAATKFPAYIWQTWKYTPAMGEFDERFRRTEASWTEKHPDYVHEVKPTIHPTHPSTPTYA